MREFHNQMRHYINYNNNYCDLLLLSTVNFGYHYTIDPVTISPSTGSSTAGRTDYSLMCSATLFEPNHLPSGVPSPNFRWSYNGNISLPSGVTTVQTIVSSSNSTSETYTSTLQFSPLSQSHTGYYTCRLGPGILMNSAMVAVNGIAM